MTAPGGLWYPSLGLHLALLRHVVKNGPQTWKKAENVKQVTDINFKENAFAGNTHSIRAVINFGHSDCNMIISIDKLI